ncbi:MULTISPECIES: hypothetical protein [unclassified Sphingobium]|uniref:hypothetical protein n=1 Tax=unclassified Sphingobium TaxID=2611147 RepID=UPI002225329A|nr:MULTISPECIES: hypothetical protein [unclassified Sphingobium]MCW2413263.1 multisubunit Na+/H+ antiporter MnhG subunit [Sphingobium sp. B8D3D]MCW2414439.1 multisubunit Na+/H+ antiporter MnhG subunit [Sphingobium sp. B8D3A]
MEFVFEVILQFLGELLLQAFFELLAELGLRSLADTMRRPRNPILSTIGFMIWGTIAGGVSLFILPHSVIEDPSLRTINLFITPVILGAMMALVGQVRLKKGQDLIRLDKFSYAFVFAFFMSIVRYVWAA